VVTQTEIIQGRPIGPAELAQVRQLLAAHPDWSRYRLSRALATLWQWRNGAGQLKDMAARTLLSKLAQRGWIALPPPQRTPFDGWRHRRPARPALAVPPAPVDGPLRALWPVELRECSGSAPERARFEALLHPHHYLGCRTVGENLRYLAADAQGRPVACALFGAAAWQCAPRDAYLGWSPAARARHLPLVANNTRLLVLPWVRVPHLATYLLGRLAQRVSADWQAKYGHPLWLLESFVETGRFAGTAYRAANWVRVGQTQGRSRQDQPNGAHAQVAVKDVYLLPLHRRFRQRLQSP
jgi:hypothetical protein